MGWIESTCLLMSLFFVFFTKNEFLFSYVLDQTKSNKQNKLWKIDGHVENTE